MEEIFIIAGITAGLAFGAAKVLDGYRLRNRLKAILREHLTDPRWNWRTFEGLKNAIHADNATTTDLLTAIGARRSEGDKDVWTLKV